MASTSFTRRTRFQSTHSLRSATSAQSNLAKLRTVSIHALLAECDRFTGYATQNNDPFQSTHSLRSATAWRRFPCPSCRRFNPRTPCGVRLVGAGVVGQLNGFNPRTPCGVRQLFVFAFGHSNVFQSTHSLRSATAPDLIHCYSTEQIILCANLPKKTVIARLLFLSIYLSIFYSQCITPIADLPGNSCELEVGAQAMFNSL